MRKIKIQVKLPIQEFFESESASGILLIAAAVIALILANSPLSQYYFTLLNMHITVALPFIEINKSLLHWINDGLMAIFFLLVGMEIKRELVHGELSGFKSAALPIIAAVGGAVIPAIIYLSLNAGTAYERGWGIPMATDIAFAVGLLTLLGNRVPLWAKIFLTALAVVDDFLAVIVIAIFYTVNISSIALMITAISIVILAFLNWRKVNSLVPYLLMGIILWAAVLKSGVHATIAGVILGFMIPIKKTFLDEELINNAEKSLSLLKELFVSNDKKKQLKEAALNYLGDVVKNSEAPLHRLEHKLHGWVAFLVMPVFAFANSGLVLNVDVISEAFSSTITWGIILGLFFGKQLGIFLPTILLIKFGRTNLRFEKRTIITIYGLAILGGIGFTMSLFISSLAFKEAAYIENAKIGIIVASLISGICGYALLRIFCKE
ncbi:MAG: Na+/H+ antiporter NhaA [Bacteroidota bacterium]